MAVLDILTAPPPQGVLVAQAEDLGSDSGIVGRDPSVTVVYATTATLDEVHTYYLALYPEYDLGAECCLEPGTMDLNGQEAGNHVSITISLGAPHYSGHNSPSPSPAPEGADLYVVVSAIRFLDP